MQKMELTNELQLTESALLQGGSPEKYNLYNDKGYQYLQSKPLFVGAMKIISPLLSELREYGPDNQKDSYHHSMRTAIIAYEFGFNDEVLLHCLFHDFLSSKHLSDIPVETRKEILGAFCLENDIDPNGMIAKLDSLEQLHVEAKRSASLTNTTSIVGLIRQGKINELPAFVDAVNSHDALPFIVNTCEAVDNLRFPRPPKYGERVDLIEDMVDIFSEDKARADEVLANDGMLRDAQYLLNYYLPFFEAVGNDSIVAQIKDTVIGLVTPKAFFRVKNILDSLKATHLDRAKSTFDGIHEFLRKPYEVSTERSSKQVAWKSTGSTVMKMLKEASENEQYREALTQATILGDDDAIGQIIYEVVVSLRDLSRAKIVINHASSNTLGARYIRAINEIVDIVKKSEFLTFREIDVKKNETVETSLQEHRRKHAKTLVEKGFNVRSRESGSEGTNIAIGIGKIALELQVLTSVMDERNEKNGRMAHAFYKAGIPGEVVELIRSKYSSYLR